MHLGSILRSIWSAWKRIGQAIGDVIARVVLTVFYFTVFVPFGLGVRFFADSGDASRPNGPTLWEERSPGQDSLRKARRLYS